MNCRRVFNLMSAYVDGELTGREMLAMRRHLSGCPDCSEEHESVVAVKRAVANLAVARPKVDFVSDILARLDVVTVPRHQRFADWLIRTLHDKVSPVAAALAVSGLALVLLSSAGVDRMGPTAGVDTASVPAQHVGFLRTMEARADDLVSAQPLKLAADIPGMRGVRVQLTGFSTD